MEREALVYFFGRIHLFRHLFLNMAGESGVPHNKVVKYPSVQSRQKIRALTKLRPHTKTREQETSKKIPQPGDVVCHAVQDETSHGSLSGS